MKKLKLKPQTRQLEVTAQEISENVIRLTFSSEAPVMRSFGNEILSHEPEAVDLSRMNAKAPLLFNHDVNDQIGVVERCWIEDGKGHAEVRFSRNTRAQEIKNDVLDEIMPNTSVGYRIFDAIEAGEDFVATRWQPYELSIVSIPADITVGYGRSAELEENEVNFTPSIHSKNSAENNSEDNNNPEPKEPEGEPEAAPEPEGQSEPEHRSAPTPDKDEIKRVTSIRSIAELYNANDAAERAITSGQSVEDFQRSILENLSNPTQTENKEENTMKKFSIVRALNAHMSGDWTGAEHEKEVIEGLRSDSTKGIPVPAEAFRSMMEVKNADSGEKLVDDELLVGEFIDVLYANSWLGKVGARKMSGLVGDVTIQKKQGKPTFGWLGESANITLSDFQVGEIKLAPKTMGGGVAMSRKLMKQSTPSVETLTRNSIIEGSAEAVENGALNADGTGNSPDGLLKLAPSTDSAVKAKITRNDLVDAVTRIRGKSIHGKLFALMNAAQAGEFMKEKVGGDATAVAEFVLANGVLDCGEAVDVIVTEHMPAGKVLIGDFSQLLVGAWGDVDLVPDEATLAASGGLVIRLWQDLDIAVRYPEAFAVINKKA